MDLSDVLNDIQGNPDPAAQDPNIPSAEVPPEQVNVEVTDATEPELLTEEQIKALENFKAFLVYRRAVEDKPVLDRSLATEIFTMLPEMADPVTLAKLTSAASAHNRTMLITRLEHHHPSPESLLGSMNLVYSATDKAFETLNAVQGLATSYVEAMNAELARINDQARIVFCREQINLFEASFIDVFKVNDQLIDFEPYSGKLTSAFAELRWAPDLNRITFTELDNVNLRQIVNWVSAVPRSLPSIREALNKFVENVGQELNYDTMNGMDFRNTLHILERVTTIRRIFIDNTAMLDALMKLLKLLV